MIHYVCKYTPTELFQGFGEKCAVFVEMLEENREGKSHDTLCL